VHARAGELLDAAQVLLGRHGDDREVGRALGEERLDGREVQPRVGDRAVAVAAGIDRAGEADVGRGLEDPGVVAADHPEADDRAAERL
jgi:hypothetical protein